MIKVSDIAKKKVVELMQDDGFNHESDFVRVGVKSGGCSGLSYELKFDKENKDDDKVFANLLSYLSYDVQGEPDPIFKTPPPFVISFIGFLGDFASLR